MPETETASPGGQDELVQLREALAREKDSRADAERRADSAQSQLNQNSRRLVESEVGRLEAHGAALDGQIAAYDAEIGQLQVQEADLQAEGKFLEAGQVRTKISMAVSRRVAAEDQKVRVSGAREQAARTPTDAVEAFFAANPNFKPYEQQWIRANPRYATDDGFRNRVNQAHAEATGDGKEPGTQAYFAALEAAGYGRAPTEAVTRVTPAARAAAAATEAADPETDPEESPYSDTGASGNPADPEVVIAEAAMPQETIRPGARAENPQARAAGAGTSSMAAAPSRRSLSGSRATAGRQVTLTPEQADFAFRLAQTLEPEIAAKGPKEAWKWYAEYSASQSAQDKRAKWAAGG